MNLAVSITVTAIVTVTATILLGYASYVLIEKPMIRLSRRF